MLHTVDLLLPPQHEALCPCDSEGQRAVEKQFILTFTCSFCPVDAISGTWQMGAEESSGVHFTVKEWHFTTLPLFLLDLCLDQPMGGAFVFPFCDKQDGSMPCQK